MLSVSDVLLLMGLGFSLAAPLGPVNMEMLKRTLQSKFGYILGILTGLGAMTGDFLIASTVLYVGEEYLRSIIEIPAIYSIVLMCNVGLLTYIGVSALRSSTEELPVGDDEEVIAVKPKEMGKQLATGFVLVVTSPWSYFWWTSFGGVILQSGLPLGSGADRLFVTLAFLGGIFVWVILFCVVLAISQRLASPRILNTVTNISALIIIGFAIYFFIEGVVYLLGS